MILDRSRFPQLSASDREILERGENVLVLLTQMNTAVAHFAVGEDDTSLTGIAGPALDEWREAGTEAGAIVVDARPCDPEAYLGLVIRGPMVAMGASRARLIDGTRGPLSYIAPDDYARSFAAIGAIVFNTAPTPAEMIGRAA